MRRSCSWTKGLTPSVDVIPVRNAALDDLNSALAPLGAFLNYVGQLDGERTAGVACLDPNN